MRFIIAAAVGAGALALTACSAASPDAEENVDPAQDRFTRLEEAPAEPPEVSVHGVDVEPAYYEWLEGDEKVVYRSSEKQDEAELADVPRADGSTIRIDIGSGVRPAELILAAFSDVDENGIPTEQAGDQVDCLKEVERCTLTEAEDSLSATLSVKEPPTVVVAHVTYLAESPSADGVEFLTGSWGIRLTEE